MTSPLASARTPAAIATTCAPVARCAPVRGSRPLAAPSGSLPISGITGGQHTGAFSVGGCFSGAGPERLGGWVWCGAADDRGGDGVAALAQVVADLAAESLRLPAVEQGSGERAGQQRAQRE